MLPPARARLLEYYTDWINATSSSDCTEFLRKWPCETPREFNEIEQQFLRLEARVAKDPELLGPLTPANSGTASPDVLANPWDHLLKEPPTRDQATYCWNWISALKAADAEVKRLRGVILQGAVDEMNKRQEERAASAKATPVVSALTDKERTAIRNHLQNWRYFANNESLAHLVEILVQKLWGIG